MPYLAHSPTMFRINQVAASPFVEDPSDAKSSITSAARASSMKPIDSTANFRCSRVSLRSKDRALRSSIEAAPQRRQVRRAKLSGHSAGFPGLRPSFIAVQMRLSCLTAPSPMASTEFLSVVSQRLASSTKISAVFLAGMSRNERAISRRT